MEAIPPKRPPSTLVNHDLGKHVPSHNPWRVFRIHWPNALHPTHMVKMGHEHGFRFDDASRLYRVFYCADEVETCVMETLVRNNPRTTGDGGIVIDERSLSRINSFTHLPEDRMISELELDPGMAFVPFYGHTLTRYEITNICTWESYEESQLWSRALYDHTENFDGLSFRSRFDNNGYSHAIFDRAYLDHMGNRIRCVGTSKLIEYPPFFDLLDRLRIGIVGCVPRR